MEKEEEAEKEDTVLDEEEEEVIFSIANNRKKYTETLFIAMIRRDKRDNSRVYQNNNWEKCGMGGGNWNKLMKLIKNKLMILLIKEATRCLYCRLLEEFPYSTSIFFEGDNIDLFYVYRTFRYPQLFSVLGYSVYLGLYGLYIHLIVQ